MNRIILFACILSLTSLLVHADAENMKAKEKKSNISLLLPATQQVREAAPRAGKKTKNTGLRSDGELVQARKPWVGHGSTSFSRGPSDRRSQGPSTGVSDCKGVSACNEMIATCIALGGNTTATHYDPDSGAPDGATCYK